MLAGGLCGSLAGCAAVAHGLDDAEGRRSPPPSRSPTPTSTPTATPTRTASRPTATPGYKDYHWHGQLFIDIDGVLVDFAQPKYYLENLGEEEIAFHFHETAHGPNEWSNELSVVTLAEGLNLLPDVAYAQRDDGAHELTIDGTTYRERDGGTRIAISEGTAPVDPTRHYVRHGEVYWIQISTGAELERPADHGDARIGTLFVDVNNRRYDLALDPGRDPTAVSAFHVHDDGHEYRWYAEGPPPTLAEALGALAEISYAERGGEPVVTVASPDAYAGTYRASDPGTTITVRQRASAVTPSGYTLGHGDVIWVYVHTDQAPDNEH